MIKNKLDGGNVYKEIRKWCKKKDDLDNDIIEEVN